MNLKDNWDKRSQKGFTLVELLVVISIIGVLATLVLLQLSSARARARDTKRIADVNQIRTSVESYFEDNNGTYPTAIDSTSIGKYLTKVPTDPLTAQPYGYSYHTNAGGKVDGYQVWAKLEQTATALNGDADIDSKSLSWTGSTVNGDDANCKTDVNTCVYDQGVTP